MFCPSCGISIPDNAVFCPQCGLAIELEKTPPNLCPVCQASIEAGTVFCGNCGASLNEGNSEVNYQQAAMGFEQSQASGHQSYTGMQREKLTWGNLMKNIWKSTWSSVLKSLPMTLVFFLGSLLFHTYVMVGINQGFSPDTFLGSQLLATQGNVISATILWTLLSTLVFLSIKRKRKGEEGLLKSILVSPKQISGYIKINQKTAPAAILTGAGMALIIAGIMSGTSNLVLALGVSVLFASPIGKLFAILIRSTWNSIWEMFGVKNKQIKSHAVIEGYLNMAGCACGFLLGMVLIWDSFFGLVILGVAAALMFSGRDRGGTPVMPIMIFFFALVYFIGDTGFGWDVILADDGGEAEAGGWANWLGSQGSVQAIAQGVLPSAGASMGPSIAGALTSVDPGQYDIDDEDGEVPPEQNDIPPEEDRYYDEDGYDQWGYDQEGYNRNGYDRSGFDRDGWDRDGYGRDGFDYDGFNRNGFDSEGYGRDGFDQYGYNRQGYDTEGYDMNGYNKDGFDMDGFDNDGYDHNGLDRNGFDSEGFDKDGFDANGYDGNGYDRDGYNSEGYDENGLHRDGYDADGYDKNGYDKEGYDKDGYDRDGEDKNGYDRDGYDAAGYDKNGYNQAGFDKNGFDKNGYDKNGLNADGYDKKGFDKNGYNRDGYDKGGFDKSGYNKNGFDKDGFKRNGYDVHGFDRDGLNKYGETREEFRNRIMKSIKENEDKSWWANLESKVWGAAEFGAKATKFVADKSIDVLEKVTGPAGATIKKVYVFSSGVAEGVGHAMGDGQWGTHLTDGAIKGTKDLVLSTVTDKVFGVVGDKLSLKNVPGFKDYVPFNAKDAAWGSKNGIIKAVIGGEGARVGFVKDAILGKDSVSDAVSGIVKDRFGTAIKHTIQNTIQTEITKNLPVVNNLNHKVGDGNIFK